jgi:cyclopropane fatty-acyl-phospholipid synthase-like methyltransferase
MSKKSDASDASTFFNKAYRAPITFWGDTRIPKELKGLIETHNPKNSLELGCGLGRLSRFMAGLGITATGVDFSSVAIEKAKKRVANDERQPTFILGDVTNLETITEQFDVSFDVGCFHILDEEGQRKYASEVYRLLKPGATHLIWAMDHSPIGFKLNPDYIAKVFETRFRLKQSKSSRRRIVASHWYWLVRLE